MKILFLSLFVLVLNIRPAFAEPLNQLLSQTQYFHCPSGFEQNEASIGCVDINECKRGLAGCNPRKHEICFNTEGGFYCGCEIGFMRIAGKCKRDMDVPLPTTKRPTIEDIVQRCPSGYGWDSITESCQEFAFPVYVPTTTKRPTTEKPADKVAKCPSGYGWDSRENRCRKFASSVYVPTTTKRPTTEKPADTDAICLSGYGWDSRSRSCRKFASPVYVPTITERPTTEKPAEIVETCPSGYGWDSRSKSCRKLASSVYVPTKTERPTTEKPAEIVETCPSGYGWDSRSKSCRKLASPVYVPTTTERPTTEKPAEIVETCPSGYGWDSRSQSCRKFASPVYVPTTIERPTTKKPAEIVEACPSGYGWDSITKICREFAFPVYVPTITTTTTKHPMDNMDPCPVGFALHPKTRRCEKVETGVKSYEPLVIPCKKLETTYTISQAWVCEHTSYFCSEVCECPSGFELNRNTNSCYRKNFDFCKSGYHHCNNETEICKNLEDRFSYTCLCKPNYHRSSLNGVCVKEIVKKPEPIICSPIDEPCEYVEPPCECDDGFEWNPKTNFCERIVVDVCSSCDQQTEECYSGGSTKVCKCKNGYVYNWSSRICAEKAQPPASKVRSTGCSQLRNCEANSRCMTNQYGSECVCVTGYRRFGNICKPAKVSKPPTTKSPPKPRTNNDNHRYGK